MHGKNGFNAGWEQSDKDGVRSHWEQGYSASVIGVMYHRTRNAIIGLVHRNHWETPNKHAPHNVTVEDRTKIRERKKRGGDIKQAEQRNYYEDVLKPVRDEDIPLTQRKTLLELTDKTCRYPIGEPADLEGFFFCGAVPLEGKPYCAHHYKRCTVRSTWIR